MFPFLDAKVRISEHNTKQKSLFLVFLSFFLFLTTKIYLF